jgi:hypothetical protein
MPWGVCVTSGWNWTPRKGSELWRTAAKGQVSVEASVVSELCASSTWSPWLIQTAVRSGMAAKRSCLSVMWRLARPNSRA